MPNMPFGLRHILLPFALLATYFTAPAFVKAEENAIMFDCDPCLDRTQYHVNAFLHKASPGEDDPSAQLEAAMSQIKQDLRVNLHVKTFSEAEEGEMANAIMDAAASGTPPDVFLVSIPSKTIEAAVEDAISKGMPVFGLDIGYESAISLDLKGFIAMDAAKAGGMAADQISKEVGDGASEKVLYLYVTQGWTGGQSKKMEGFKQASSAGAITVDEFNVTGNDKVAKLKKMDSLLNADCSYDFVVLEDASLLDELLSSLDSVGACQAAANKPKVAVFGSNLEINKALSANDVSFAIADQVYLQGALSMLLASLYATTGGALAPSSESPYGMLQSGPVLITSDDVRSDSEQTCEDVNFPMCQEDSLSSIKETAGGSECACTDKSKIVIGGVLHAVTTDPFWDIIYTAAKNAAQDFGVELQLDRFDPEDSPETLHSKMAAKIASLCEANVDGLFLTIPSDTVVEAIRECQRLNVPIISINAGPDTSAQLGLRAHIGQIEYNAGMNAGRRMAATGEISQAMCPVHAPNNTVLESRCAGFEAGLKESGDVKYLGSVDVPEDNAVRFQAIIEEFVGEKAIGINDSWDGLGILLAGQPQVAPGLPLKQAHPDVLLGSFDVSADHYDGFESGELLFGMDQGPYMQGYLPVSILALEAYTGQNLTNHLIESGPDFITKGPTDAQQVCEANHFLACPAPEAQPINIQSNATSETAALSSGAIAGITISLVACVSVIAFLSYRVYKLTSYVKQLESEGKDVPNLSTGQMLSSFYKPVGTVVDDASVV
jgi:simple sugar transport system substrate-binding protein